MTARPEQPSRTTHGPRPLEVGMSVTQFVDRALLSSTGGHLADAARLLAGEMLADPKGMVGLSLDADLISGGAAITTLLPLMQGGYVDWIVTTGTNLHRDILHAFGVSPTRHVAGRLQPEDEWVSLEDDLWAPRQQLHDAEDQLREILAFPEFQQLMGTAEFHTRLGPLLRQREKALGVEYPSLLSAAHELHVPIFNPSPADGPLGSIVAELALVGNRLGIDASTDANEASALLISALTVGAGSMAWCLGYGPAARFLLGAPEHLGAILGTGKFPGYRHRVCLGTPPDLSIALPLLTAFLLDRVPPRPLKHLGGRRDELLDRLRQDRLQAVLKRPG